MFAISRFTAFRAGSRPFVIRARYHVLSASHAKYQTDGLEASLSYDTTSRTEASATTITTTTTTAARHKGTKSTTERTHRDEKWERFRQDLPSVSETRTSPIPRPSILLISVPKPAVEIDDELYLINLLAGMNSRGKFYFYDATFLRDQSSEAGIWLIRLESNNLLAPWETYDERYKWLKGAPKGTKILNSSFWRQVFVRDVPYSEWRSRKILLDSLLTENSGIISRRHIPFAPNWVRWEGEGYPPESYPRSIVFSITNPDLAMRIERDGVLLFDERREAFRARITGRLGPTFEERSG
ncbi:uncharacterized protein V2V93DRAFT_371222 [Kockiozyma suomiensis]|uniref:uncharacterized protein n=1 Tax=Kockiozyma suomiensis TaxID=1337062 RepID=UPI003342EF22